MSGKMRVAKFGVVCPAVEPNQLIFAGFVMDGGGEDDGPVQLQIMRAVIDYLQENLRAEEALAEAKKAAGKGPQSWKQNGES